MYRYSCEKNHILLYFDFNKCPYCEFRSKVNEELEDSAKHIEILNKEIQEKEDQIQTLKIKS